MRRNRLNLAGLKRRTRPSPPPPPPPTTPPLSSTTTSPLPTPTLSPTTLPRTSSPSPSPPDTTQTHDTDDNSAFDAFMAHIQGVSEQAEVEASGQVVATAVDVGVQVDVAAGELTLASSATLTWPWKQVVDGTSQRVFFWNTISDLVVWTRPAPGAVWERVWVDTLKHDSTSDSEPDDTTTTKKFYYWNTVTGEVRWELTEEELGLVVACEDAECARTSLIGALPAASAERPLRVVPDPPDRRRPGFGRPASASVLKAMMAGLDARLAALQKVQSSAQLAGIATEYAVRKQDWEEGVLDGTVLQRKLLDLSVRLEECATPTHPPAPPAPRSTVISGAAVAAKPAAKRKPAPAPAAAHNKKPRLDQAARLKALSDWRNKVKKPNS